MLNDLLTRAHHRLQWRRFDRLLQLFVGQVDSMTFGQLGAILGAAGITSPGQIANAGVLRSLQERIARSRAGVQRVRSHLHASSPGGGDQVVLPRSFTVMGQRFALDSWALSKVVADDILWRGRKVQRRIPSALDVDFAVLGNDQVVPWLAARMVNPRGMRFRDGLRYQHNLCAVRRVVDSLPASWWRDSLYAHWLATLRSLSAPTTDRRYPEAMRTEAWAMKTINTQLASWTQLRHDTILLVKQSYSSLVSCDYPDGLVELRPRFWARFGEMAAAAAKGFAAAARTAPEALSTLLSRQSAFFSRFADRVRLLAGIAQKQLARKPLSAAESATLRDVVQIHHGSGFTRYNGWYPRLFYKGAKDSGQPDALVADVHTDPPAPMIRDPGGVLHEAVGTVDLLLIAVRRSKLPVVYAGPTLSHYELVLPGTQRKSDSEWERDVSAGRAPPRPDWTAEYLVE